ncbi:MAG: pyridoxal phosphate-dependent aminotransferase [Bacteroidaceae bacterium]|nr:pyridoxal phosphate-dependent aminotransferase [Bacteroidaceae bacterium]
MKQTPIDYNTVASTISEMGLDDFSTATIRDIATLSRVLESKTGQPFIHLEMGVPGLKPSKIGTDAEAKALAEGCAAIYPPNGGIPRLKEAASNFIKAFIGIDVAPEGCVATTGSMQGTFAVFTTIRHAIPEKDTVLFIHPGFPVQTTQCEIIGLKTTSFDIHGFRGDKLIAKMEEFLKQGNIAAIVYSNPNNPSWVCFNEDELKGIGELATKYDTIVLEDLAYFAMDFRHDLSHPYEAPYQASVARYTDNYILSISGSKAFSYAGQRIGVSCISNKLSARVFEPLKEKFGVGAFGKFFYDRVMYTLSSGVTHSTQHAMAAMMEAACNGTFNFVAEVREYGRRAEFMKKVLLANDFYLVYDNDMGAPLADGFYFTVQYPGMTDVELCKELMFYGIAVFPLDTMGSTQQGVRVCTSFITQEQFPLFEERIIEFRNNHKI